MVRSRPGLGKQLKQSCRGCFRVRFERRLVARRGLGIATGGEIEVRKLKSGAGVLGIDGLGCSISVGGAIRVAFGLTQHAKKKVRQCLG